MKTLVAGCSYTENAAWPQHLLPGHTILNTGIAAAGNTYISNSVLYNLDFKPDFVFVLWSGINRVDFRVPKSKFFAGDSGTYRTVDVGESTYMLSGHSVDTDRGWLAGYNAIKADHWPEISSLDDWFKLSPEIKAECLQHRIYLSSHGGKENADAYCHQYFVTQCLEENKKYQSEITFQNMLTCFSVLDKLKIPYRFGFIYDIWSKNLIKSQGQAIKNKYHDLIDWEKFINLPPFNFGIKHDYLSSDQFHLTDEGMLAWADNIQVILKKDPELKHLF